MCKENKAFKTFRRKKKKPSTEQSIWKCFNFSYFLVTIFSCVWILNQQYNIPYRLLAWKKNKVKEKSWKRKAWEGTIILNRLYYYCLIKIMKHSGWRNRGWQFTLGISSHFVLPAYDMPPCGERLRPTNHGPSMTAFCWAKRHLSQNSFLLPNFSLFSPSLDVWCSVYFAWISPVSCGEDEGKQQAVRLLKRWYQVTNTVITVWNWLLQLCQRCKF